MIQLSNITEKDLENKEKLVEIINNIFLIKMIKPENQERLNKCFEYYRGQRPTIAYDEENKYTPKVFNLIKPAIDIATKTFIGTLPDITTNGNKSEKEKISKFNQKLYNRSFGKSIYQTSKNSSICGNGFLAIYNKVGDTFPRYRELNPQFADVVYDCSLSKNRLFAFNIVEMNLDEKLGTSKYAIYIYTKSKIFAFECSYGKPTNPAQANANKSLTVIPYAIFSTNDKASNITRHGYSDIPIIEFPNNAEYKGDAECVFEIADLYNEVQNNRALNVKQVVDYLLLLKNVRLGNEEEQSDLITMVKKHRVLPVEGDDVDAKYLSSPLNQTEAETLRQSIKADFHFICRVPDLSSVDFSQNASDPILKIKTKPLIDLCCEKELSFIEPYLDVIRITLNWCKVNDKKGFANYNFDVDNVSLEFAHPLPSNDLDIVTQISNLHNAGALPIEMALQQISWIPSVNEALKQIKKVNDDIDKRKQSQNNNNIVANATNLERQNAKIVSTDQLDNQRNGANGMGKNISDNNVE